MLLIFRLDKVFEIEIIIFRFENHNLELKCQFLDQISLLNLNNNFQNCNVNFHIQIKILKLKCPFLDSIINF